MQELDWTDEQKALARATVRERYDLNSVANQVVPQAFVDKTTTTVPWKPYDFKRLQVDDRKTLALCEPAATVRLTRAQTEDPDLAGAMTTLHRASSRLARWVDTLVFRGFGDALEPRPLGITMPSLEADRPLGLREAALRAEAEECAEAIAVDRHRAGESLVSAFHAAVGALEGRGYFRDYHLVLGQGLWEAINSPNEGALVLPKDRIEPSLQGGGIYRTTTLPEDEALLLSLDGPTVDCVTAGEASEPPFLEFLRTETDDRGEETYLLRLRLRFALRVREDRAIVRLRTVDRSEKGGGDAL